MSDTSDKTGLLDWFMAWPWPEQSGETLGDEECEVIRGVILERDALQARLDALEAEIKQLRATSWAEGVRGKS